LQFSAKAAIQTASMMFSILRRKVARSRKCKKPLQDWRFRALRRLTMCYVFNPLI
jgi:hypothetical protein